MAAPGYEGLTSYNPYVDDTGRKSGEISFGVRGINGQTIGGENAAWGINPATGQEEPAFAGPDGNFYLASDLIGKYGSIEAASKLMNPNADVGGSGNTNSPYLFGINGWGSRPGNDFLSGKEGWMDALKIGLMAAPVGIGAAFGAAGSLPGAAGTAAYEGGAGAAGAASGVGTAATTAGGLGEGALGTGLAVPGGVGTGTGVGAAGLSGTAAAGTALAPGYFAAEGVGGGATGTTGAATGGSALSLPSSEGVLAGLARGLPGALGAVGAAYQANQYGNLANDYMAVGAPSRARFEASYAPGFSMENDPGYKDALDQAAKATLHGLSIGGNPAGSPNAWAQSLTDLYQKTAYQALQQYRNQNASAGGLAALTQAAPAAAGNAVSSTGNIFNGVGAAANDIFNPPKSLTQLFREIRAAGY
jgi:hypothetical protein